MASSGSIDCPVLIFSPCIKPPALADGESRTSCGRDERIVLIFDFSSSAFLLNAIPANSSKMVGELTEMVTPLSSSSSAFLTAFWSLIRRSIMKVVSAIKSPYPSLRLGGSLPAPGSDVLNIGAEFGSFLRREKADKVEHRLLTRESVYHVSEALLWPLHCRQLRVSLVRDGYVPRAHCLHTYVCVQTPTYAFWKYV